METILSQLLEPDNEIIKAATAQLRTAFKQPGVIPELCNVLRQVLTFFQYCLQPLIRVVHMAFIALLQSVT